MAKRASGKQAGKKRSATTKKAVKTVRRKSAAKKGTPKRKAPAPKRKAPAPKRKASTRTAPARKPVTKKPTTMASIGTTVKGRVAGAIAAVRRRVGGAGPDAITLLEADHRRMEDLLKQGGETTERAVTGRRELLDAVTAELTLHELIEEQVLYPALQAHPEAKAIVLEGLQEHHVADLIVKELHEVATDNEQWGAKFKVLQENIEHHIEEEEGTMFRTARAVFSQEDLEAMGAQMAAMKAQAKSGR